MGFDGIYTLAVLVALIAVLISRKMSTDVAFLTALAALLVTGVLEPQEAVGGFANPAVITVGLLYVVAQGLKETGGMIWVSRRLLGRPRSVVTAQLRLLVPVAGLSAFVNNTPIVAMFLPVLSGWAKQSRINPARLFMPLSFAAMLGGTCTLIGTSTNLVVNELLIEHAAHAAATGLDVVIRPFEMFTLLPLGAVLLVAGLLYVLVAGRLLLPVEPDQAPTASDPRNFMLWMRVLADGPLVGRSVDQAGLRHLSGLFLTTIERQGLSKQATPEDILQAGDRLQFVGDVGSVVELQQMQGVAPNTEQIDKLEHPRHRRRLIEAVVSESSPLVGKSVREGEFRTRFNAVIIAVHRSGERIGGKIGDIVLRPGDTLLLEAPPGFAARYENSSAFYLVSERSDVPTPRWGRAWIAIGLMVALVASIAFGLLPPMTAALATAMGMILTRCCTGTSGRMAIDWQVLIVIGSAFGIARAMEQTGVASLVADAVLGWSAGLGERGLVAGVFLVTVLFTAVMTNNAAAALVFPIAFQACIDQGLAFEPCAVAIAIAASAAFMTPIGYQTNLMVAGPGGYGWTDFLRFGTPLTLLSGVLCVALAPVFYG